MNDLAVSAKAHQSDIICVTESWLDSEIDDGYLTIDENFSPPLRHDRPNRQGGGVAVWINKNFQFKVWHELILDDFETLWLTVWSNQMPRDCSHVLLGVVYYTGTLVHQHRDLTNHIINAVDHIKRVHPYAKTIITGDFNQYPEKHVKHHLCLKQTVTKPTRGNVILDKFLTDMVCFYPDCIVTAPVANSDHNAIVAYPSIQYDKGVSKYVETKVNGMNERSFFAYDIQRIRWEEMYQLQNCEQKVKFFTEKLQSLMQRHFPVKIVQRHDKDKPWVTDNFKSMIAQRQHAFMSGNMSKYRELRNKTNRLAKLLERNFYKKKVEHLKTSNNRSWWKHMKGLLGMGSSHTGPLESLSQSTNGGDMCAFVSDINNFFKSVASHIEPLSHNHPFLTQECEVPDHYLVSIEDMEKRLSSLKVHKSTGPDDVPAWVLRDFAHCLAGPLASIANDSIREGSLPSEWKTANTIPLPKVQPPKSIQTDLRPISITPVAAKTMEYFPVKLISEAIVDKIDCDQYGGVKNSSTALALHKIVHCIASAMDKPSTTVQMLLCDFTKAFDFVDHTIVVNKLSELGLHECLLKWCANFLTQRTQRVKIGNHLSEIVEMHAGCPQGTLFGPLAFIAHINDLRPPKPVLTIKYVDDTTIIHTMSGNDDNTMQDVAEYLHRWATQNNMVFNVKKTKEMVFTTTPQICERQEILIGDTVIEKVTESKVLGVTIQSNLKWNAHIDNTIKKANKRLYLLRLCKRAGVAEGDLVSIYTCLIRSILEYCCTVWHTSLPNYLHNDLERVQRRALQTVFPGFEYEECLKKSNLKTLYLRREELCKKLFTNMCCKEHKLNGLLPNTSQHEHNLRRSVIPHVRANSQRFYNCFIPYCLRNFQ